MKPLLSIVFSFIVIISISSCSAIQPTTGEISFFDSLMDQRMDKDRLGCVSEHVIDMHKRSFVFFDGRKGDGGVSASIKNMGFVGFPIDVHFIQHIANDIQLKSFGSLWKPNNRVLKDLRKTYGDDYPTTFYEEKVGYYIWYSEIVRKMWSTNIDYIWLYLGNSIFDAESVDEINVELFEPFMVKIKNNRYWKVKTKYLGTADVTWVGWGNVHLFEAVEMLPLGNEK